MASPALLWRKEIHREQHSEDRVLRLWERDGDRNAGNHSDVPLLALSSC